MKAFNSAGALIVTGVGGGGGGGGTFFGGFSTMGNTAGNSGVVTDRMVLVGSNNITLSGSTNAGSITVSILGAGGGGSTLSFFATGNTTQSSSGTINSTSVILRGSNIVSVGVSNGSLVFDATTPAQSNQQMTLFATGNTTQSSTGTTNASSVIFRGDGIVSVGITGGSIEISGTQSNQAFSAGGGSSAFQTLSFSDNAQASFTNNAGQLAITNVRLSFFATGNTTQSSSGTINASSVILRGSNIVSVGVSNGSLVFDATTVAQSNQTGGIYVTAQSTGQSSSSTYDLRTLSLVGDGIVSIGWSNSTLRISATQSNQAFSAAGGSSAFQTLGFSDNAQASFTNTNGSVAITNVRLSMFATSNTTQSSSGTANASSLIFAGAGVASVGVTGGSVVISVPSGGGGGFSGGVSTGGNTAGSTGTVSNQIVFVGSNGITLSQSTGGASSATITFAGWPLISSYENFVPGNSLTQTTFNSTGLTLAHVFMLPLAGSFSFLRFPVTMSTQASSITTLASANATGSMQQVSTLNLGIYSLGTGASSESLMSVFVTSAGFTFSVSISISNSTQASYTQGITQWFQGASTTQTTQYSLSTSVYNFSLPFQSGFSSRRFIDLPFATSLSPGPYWLLLGMSSSTAGGGALTDLSNVQIRYSNHPMAAMTLPSAGAVPMGRPSTDGAPYYGAGSFTTAGGGTTAALHSTAMTSVVSNMRFYFQLLRSA